MNDEIITYGKFVTKVKTRPAIEVDCSKWADTTTGDWTFGSFVTKKQTQPAIESELTIPYLRLKVSFLPGVSLETLTAITKAMIEKLCAAAPDLNLVYDTTLSDLDTDSRGATIAVIALRPQTPGVDIDRRLSQLIEAASKTLREAAEASGIRFMLDKAD